MAKDTVKEPLGERLHGALKSAEKRARRSFGRDIGTPGARALSWLHFHLFDHAWLRGPWTNFDRVAEGVYRSNHPGPRRLARYRRMGIRAVLNLRGDDGYAPWLFEEEACRALGLDLRVAKIYARKPATRAEMIRLIDTLREMPKPFVLHCKSGADRAGLAAVLYAHVIDGQPLAEARRHLHWRYIHFKGTATGVVDHILDMYEARAAESPISLEDWIRTEYTARDAAISFARARGKPVPAKYRDAALP
jgi:protein tyrosine phosphatase (PTP) superfamily phosphohydrolase (DUF442 family)